MKHQSVIVTRLQPVDVIPIVLLRFFWTVVDQVESEDHVIRNKLSSCHHARFFREHDALSEIHDQR